MKFLFLSILHLLAFPALSKTFTIASPNEMCELKVETNSTLLNYQLSYKGKTVLLPSQLSLQLKGYTKAKWDFDSCRQTQFMNHDWNAVWGQKIQMNDPSNVSVFHFHHPTLGALKVEFQVFDKALAFRYVLNGKACLQNGVLEAEQTQINVQNDGKAWWAWADYNTQEQLFHETAIQEATWVNTPVTFRYSNGLHLAIHEAALQKYARMTLKRDSKGVFTTDLVPWKNGDLVRFNRSLTSPWRVILVGENASDLLESTIILSLNEPNRIKNTTWIKPISYIGIWWEMHLGTKTWTEGPNHGATTERAKQAINFAATHRVGGVLVEGWNTGWDRWGADSVFDQTTSASDYDLKEIARYAKWKGVELIVHCETGGDAPFFEQRMDYAFALYRRLGIRYVKTGYAGAARPIGEHLFGQGMVEHFQKVVETAAKYELMLDVHECIQPTGLERTWPNLMTGESVRGQEWEAWSAGHPASHTALLPFTRGLAGPMDYTPGIFDVDFSNRKEYTKWNGQEKEGILPRVHTSPIHQMALMVVLYSPLQMAADVISNYEQSQEWKWFLSVFQPDYVNTKILYAEVGGPVVIAREQKNGVWVVGAIGTDKTHEIEFSWDSLHLEEFHQTYVMVENPKHPDQLLLRGAEKKSPTEKVVLQPGGGTVWVIIPRPKRILFDD